MVAKRLDHFVRISRDTCSDSGSTSACSGMVSPWWDQWAVHTQQQRLLLTPLAIGAVGHFRAPADLKFSCRPPTWMYSYRQMGVGPHHHCSSCLGRRLAWQEVGVITQQQWVPSTIQQRCHVLGPLSGICQSQVWVRATGYSPLGCLQCCCWCLFLPSHGCLPFSSLLGSRRTNSHLRGFAGSADCFQARLDLQVLDRVIFSEWSSGFNQESIWLS